MLDPTEQLTKSLDIAEETMTLHETIETSKKLLRELRLQRDQAIFISRQRQVALERIGFRIGAWQRMNWWQRMWGVGYLISDLMEMLRRAV